MIPHRLLSNVTRIDFQSSTTLGTQQTRSQRTQANQNTQSPTSATGSTGAQVPPEDQDDADEPENRELPLDQVFEILKNERRRLVLHYLESNDGESTLSDLAEHIAAIENDTTVKAISSTQRKRVYVGLYQCHLPKMDDMDIIEFDQNRGTVKLSQNAEQVKSYLGEPDEQPWYKMYLGVTVVGATLFVIAQAGASQYGLTPAVILFLLILGIGTLGILHARDIDSLP